MYTLYTGSLGEGANKFYKKSDVPWAMNSQYTGSLGEGPNKSTESQMYLKQCILYT